MEERLPPIPARMLNEHVYCPRLFALEWLNGQFADSADTVEGRTVHRRVDQETKASLPEAGDEEPMVARSVYLGDEELGLVARIDLVEADGGEVIPVDYKKGRPSASDEQAWPSERVQICAQALLLRAHGYTCTRGYIWYAGARRRVEIPITEDLVELTLHHRDRCWELLQQGELPPPLVDSPKCPRCSLVGICLPDEQNMLAGRTQQVRPMIPPRDDGVPLYVQLYGGYLSKDHDEIVVSDRKEVVARARLEETSRIVLIGNITVSTPLLHELAQRDIPVAYHGYGGWFYGQFTPASGQNVLTRIAQHRVANDATRALELARSFVHSKICNCRVLLRRNAAGVPSEVLRRMKELAHDAMRAEQLAQLLGIEGVTARMYYGEFARMLKGGLAERFAFSGRNRRPPRDPVNAMLSFAYACLARQCTEILTGIGLDPYVGFLHQPRPGRPALALDLMEEFRPTVADSVVVWTVNNGVLQPSDFIERTTGVALTKAARRRFVQAWERRLDELITHPTFGTRLSYRRVIEVQARLLGKVLLGELDAYPEFRIR